MASYSYSLPRILKQKSEDCSSYSVSGLIEWHLYNAGIALQVDADKLYTETTTRGEGQTLGTILSYAKAKGVPLLNGSRQQIKDFTRVTASWAFAEQALAAGPLVMSMKIPYGKSLDTIMSQPPYILDTLFKTHSVVLCGSDSSKKLFRIADIKGSEYAQSGYWNLSYQLFNLSNVFDLYSIQL